MATNVNVQMNHGQITVIDNMVYCPNSKPMTVEEYEWRCEMTRCEQEARRASLEKAQAEKAKKDNEEHTLAELISVVTMLTQEISALRADMK